MTGDSKESIVASVKGYGGPADYILLEGGTNDNTNSIPIGTIQSGYDASYDETTYTGALESALQYIMDNYPLARKFFLIPHSFQKDNSYVDDFHDRAIEVCEKWNMPVLDMRKMSQIAMTEANKATYTRNPNTNQGDGVHPTEIWYRAFYSPVVDQFMRSLGEYMEISEPPENVPVMGVTLDQSSITLVSAGQIQQLIVSVSPSNVTNKTVTWKSDHPEYATVTQNGVVQAVANGAAVITVRTQDGNKVDTCSVIVQIDEEPEIDHQELAKIGVDINAYFDTEIIPDADTDFEIKARVESADISGTSIVGVRDANNKYTVSITDNWYCTRGALSSTAGTAGYAPAPSAGAANRYLRSDGTWSVPPDTNTTYSVFKGATTSMAGGVGLVPAPSTGSATRYLRSDGTWQVPPDTNTTYGVATTSTNGLMSSSDKSKLNNIDANANHYTLPTASRTTLGGVKTTSTVTSSSGHTACPIISGVPYYKTINIVNNLTTNTSGYALDARMGRQLDIELNNVQSDISWLTEGIQILGLNGSGTHTKCRIEVVDITANFNNGTVTIPKTSIIPTGAEGSLQRVFAQLKSAKAAIITSATVSGTNAVVNCANLSGTPYTGSITITLLAIISITYFDS